MVGAVAGAAVRALQVGVEAVHVDLLRTSDEPLAAAVSAAVMSDGEDRS